MMAPELTAVPAHLQKMLSQEVDKADAAAIMATSSLAMKARMMSAKVQHSNTWLAPLQHVRWK